MTNEQIEKEFRRQVYLCGSIGRKKMLEIIGETSPPLKPLSEIEISDEEIEQAFNEQSISGVAPPVKIEGAKWYREELKKRLARLKQNEGLKCKVCGRPLGHYAIVSTGLCTPCFTSNA